MARLKAFAKLVGRRDRPGGLPRSQSRTREVQANQERDQARREVQEIQNRENTPRLLPFPIDSWVRVTNNHRGFQGTIGRVIGTPSFVRATVRGYYGPGANITFDRGTSNLELTQEPRISLDSSLPTNRSNRNSRRQSNLSSSSSPSQ